MQVKNATSREGLPLTYYVAGTGERQVVLIGAPGMSVRFWLPLVARLESQCRILAFEYRGFPNRKEALTLEQASFERCLDDLEMLWAIERIGRADIVSWCAGTWLMMAWRGRHPPRVRSLTAIGIGDGRSNEPTQFDAAVADMKSILEESPASAARVVSMMQRTGLLRDDAFFDAMTDGGGGPTFAECPPYMLFDHPAGLLSYVRLFDDFQKHFLPMDGGGKPMLLVRGGQREISEPDVLLDAPDTPNTKVISFANTSNFVLIQRAGRVNEQIGQHLKRASGPGAASMLKEDVPS